jgi:hypothetical protein
MRLHRLHNEGRQAHEVLLVQLHREATSAQPDILDTNHLTGRGETKK